MVRRYRKCVVCGHQDVFHFNYEECSLCACDLFTDEDDISNGEDEGWEV